MHYSLNDIQLIAGKRDKEILCTEFDYKQIVIVKDRNSWGCQQFIYDSAMVEEYDDYFVVYAEHHPFVIYHRSDFIYFVYNRIGCLSHREDENEY